MLPLKKTELQTLPSEKMERDFIRSKSRWIDSDEKPYSFFLTLEKRKCTEKTINQIQSLDDNDNRAILSNAFEFFRRINSKDDTIKKANLSEVFQNVDLPHLSPDRVRTRPLI